MPTDLPERIRDALRADEIGAADLRQPTMRAQARPATRSARLLAAASAAVVVAAIAVVISLVATSDGNGQAAGQPDVLAGVAGYRWEVTSVRDARGTLTVPQASRAQIGFSRTGVIVGNDGVNMVTGRYHATAGGYRVITSATTAIGAVGDDPVRDRIVAAVDAMFAVAGSDSSSPGTTDLHVTVALSGDTLTLRRGDTTLTLTRAGAQPEAQITSGSSASVGAPACPNGGSQRGFGLSVASGAHGTSSVESALKRFLEHNELGLGPYQRGAWSIRHTSADSATATSRHPVTVIKLARTPGQGWFAESGYTCS